MVNEKKNKIDILDFMPKYPNINKNKHNLLNPYADDFYESLFRKKELYDNKLKKTELFPEQPGDLMDNQKIIANLFSSRTPYDELLLYGTPGSGKTCLSISAIEQIKNEKSTFTGAIILAEGKGLINNFINELVFKCTSPDKYKPENYDDLTDLEKIHRINKNVGTYYTFNTFETFAKNLSTLSDEQIKEFYSNKIIVVDEAHNIRLLRKKAGKLNIYKQFHRLFHLTKNRKILLLTGTPMKDLPEEIASLMNLILPLDSQIETGDDFVNKYLVKNEDDRFILNPDTKDELKAKMKGRVSFLKSMVSSVKQVFHGEIQDGMTHFILKKEKMSKFQSKYYIDAYDRDKNSKGVYTNSRQASLFVYPDGSYGSEGFSKYMKQEKRKALYSIGEKEKFYYSYKLSKKFLKKFKGKTDDEKLEIIKKYSITYYNSIKLILESRRDGKIIFLYCEFVSGSGLILLSKLLELFSFSNASGKEGANSKKSRYAIISNDTSSTKEIQMILERSNKPDNMYGEIINVLLGSSVVSEGYSIKNVQKEVILTPHWNYSETVQAIARGFRLGSHNMLLEHAKEVTLDIYQFISIPRKNRGKSIDLQMYKISEFKDFIIKAVERLLMECAVDCALNYERNRVIGKDGTRECEYMQCDYYCDGIDKSELKEISGADEEKEVVDIESKYDESDNKTKQEKMKTFSYVVDKKKLDLSTYQIYYNGVAKIRIINKLLELFREKFQISLQEMVKIFSEDSLFNILTTTRLMINENYGIVNKYGFKCFLREQNNIYFLVDNLFLKNDYMSVEYTENIIINDSKNILTNMYSNALPKLVKKFFKMDDKEKLQKILTSFPMNVQELLLENAYISFRDNKVKNVFSRDFILEFYKNDYQVFSNKVVSFLIDDKQRCLDVGDEAHGSSEDEKGNGSWYDCKEDYSEDRNKKLKEMEEKLDTNNEYGYRGLYNKALDAFCLKDLKVTGKEKNFRDRKSGKKCGDFSKPELNKISIKNLDLDYPIEFDNDKLVKDKTIDQLWSIIINHKYYDEKFIDSKKDYDEYGMKRIIYWFGQTRPDICKSIFTFFKKKNMISVDKNCGTQLKRKK